MPQTKTRHRVGPRHRAERTHKRRLRGRDLLTSAAFIGGAAILGVTSTGSLAQWNGTVAIPDQSVASGSFGITVNNVTEYQATPSELAALQKMLPGDHVQGQVTLKNIGHAAASISASTASTAALEVRLYPGACNGVIGGASSTITPTSLGSLQPGVELTVCVQFTLSPGAAQGATAGFIINFAAIQEP